MPTRCGPDPSITVCLLGVVGRSAVMIRDEGLGGAEMERNRRGRGMRRPVVRSPA